MRRVCPACSRRVAELVDPDCAVCGGFGVVVLHPAALSIYDPLVVSEAVGLALEVAAREIDTRGTLSDDLRAELAGSVAALLAAQIIDRPGPVVSLPPRGVPSNVRQLAPRRRGKRAPLIGQAMFGESPAVVVETMLNKCPAPYDMTVLNAAPHVYAVGERPLMRGLPVLSAAGHPSHLARITDPQDTYGSTSKDTQQRAVRNRQARVLVAAAVVVATEQVSG